MGFIQLALAAALTSLLVAPVAFAASSCLKHPFTLGDQRGLAAVRSSLDVACPCDSFAKRGDYQACARDVVNSALQSGTLRSHCARDARNIAKSSSCGSDRVPCGRIRQSDRSKTCKLTRASGCEDTGKFVKNACGEETHCADVVDWTAASCHDVRETGPYAPGFRMIQYTKDSAVNPGTPRVLDTAIWYPAPAGSGPISDETGGVENAPLDLSGGPYPLVLFSHGSCGYPFQSLFLTPFLATHGFIVVAPPHPGNTVNEFPGCRSATAQLNSFVERPPDMSFVMNQILAADLDPGSPLFGAVDENHIAMTGHSFGGFTTYRVTNNQPRITAAVVMAPFALANSNLKVPSLTILGHIDTVVDNGLSRDAYDRSLSPKLLVEIENAGHYAFSDFCFPASDCNPPVTLTQVEAHEAALRFILPFLKVHLAGDASWAPLLEAPAQPGFVHASE